MTRLLKRSRGILGLLDLDKGFGAGAYSRGKSAPKAPSAPATASAPSAPATASAPSAPATTSAPGGAAPATTASPGGAGGTPGAPGAGAEGRKRGGKYISREWVNGAWQYEYQSNPHPTAHGMEDAWQDHHTLDATGDDGSNWNKGDEQPSQEHLSAAYGRASANGEHTQPGYSSTVVHPITGQNFKITVGDLKPDPKMGTKQIISIEPVDGKGNKEKLITTPGLTRARNATGTGQAEAWKDVHNWFRAQAGPAQAEKAGRILHMKIVHNGVEYGQVMQVQRAYNPKTNKMEAPAGKKAKEVDRGWYVKLAEGTPLRAAFSKDKKGSQLFRSSPEHASSAALYLQGVVEALHEQQANPSASVEQRLSAGESYTDIISTGAPYGIVSTGKGSHAVRKWGNDLGGQPGQAAAVNDMAARLDGTLVSSKNEKGDRLGEAIPSIEEAMDPNRKYKAKDLADMPVLAGYINAAKYYRPGAKGQESLSDYLADTIGHLQYQYARRNSIKPKEGMDSNVVSDKKVAEQSMMGGGGPQEVEDIANQMDSTEYVAHMRAKNSTETRAKTYSNQQNDHFDMMERDPQVMGSPLVKDLLAKFRQALEDTVTHADLSHIPQGKLISTYSAIQQPLREAAMKFAPNEELIDYFLIPPRKVKEPGDTAGQQEVAQKSLAMIKAIVAILEEERLEKANFNYSHKEGNDMYPQYMYKDETGNYSKRGNAPKGHTDYDGSFEDAEEDQMSQETAPQFYTHDGRKLSRAPYTGADIQWNSNYHKNDPQNLWAARWVNPISGEHEFSYIDSDLRDQKQYRIHRENSMTDSRLPNFRQYVSALFNSVHQKDKTVAIILALLDQGRFRVKDLMALRVRDVALSREVMSLGGRKVHAGPNLAQHLGTLTGNRHPDEPLFATAPVSVDGEMDYTKMRRFGPHFVVNLLQELGVSAESLQTYHASQSYSMSIQRIFGSHDVTYDAAHHFSMLEVASEMGHNLDKVEDYGTALEAIEQSAVDPIVVQAIKQTCESMGVGANGAPMLKRPVHSAVPHVSMVITGRTPDEEEFSRWLRVVPIHNYPSQEESVEDPTAQMPM